MKSFLAAILIAVALPVSARDYSCTPNGSGGLDCRQRGGGFLDGYRAGGSLGRQRQEAERQALQNQLIQEQIEQQRLENERLRLQLQEQSHSFPYRGVRGGSAPKGKTKEAAVKDITRCAEDGANAKRSNGILLMNTQFIRCMENIGYTVAFEAAR